MQVEKNVIHYKNLSMRYKNCGPHVQEKKKIMHSDQLCLKRTL